MRVSNGFALHPWPTRPRSGSTADFAPSGSRLDGAAMLVQEMLKKDEFSKQQHPTSRGDSIAPSQSQPCDGLRSKEREPLLRAAQVWEERCRFEFMAQAATQSSTGENESPRLSATAL